MKMAKEDRAIQPTQFDAFVTDYKKLVITICYSFVGNYFTAEDLCQETFISAYKNFTSFDGANPKGWLTRIAANKCKDYLKKSSTRMEYVGDEALMNTQAAQKENPEERMIAKEVRQDITGLINELHEPYREALKLFLLDGFSPGEIAQKKNVPAKTAQTWCYRGKKLLKEKYKEQKSYD